MQLSLLPSLGLSSCSYSGLLLVFSLWALIWLFPHQVKAILFCAVFDLLFTLFIT